MIGLTAGLSFALLDQWSPGVAAGTRQGTGFGIGYNITRGISGGAFKEIEEVEAFDGVENTVKDTSNNLTIDNIPYDLVH
jgi:predicted porin